MSNSKTVNLENLSDAIIDERISSTLIDAKITLDRIKFLLADLSINVEEKSPTEFSRNSNLFLDILRNYYIRFSYVIWLFGFLQIILSIITFFVFLRTNYLLSDIYARSQNEIIITSLSSSWSQYIRVFSYLTGLSGVLALLISAIRVTWKNSIRREQLKKIEKLRLIEAHLEKLTKDVESDLHFEISTSATQSMMGQE